MTKTASLQVTREKPITSATKTCRPHYRNAKRVHFFELYEGTCNL